jgi:hypothetical protein
MPLAVRFAELPPPETTIETSIMDLKAQVSPENHVELAKDVAAFANHLGGCLLIGAIERESRVGEYKGIPTEFADRVQTAYSQAVAQRCSPKPIVDFQRFPTPGGDAVLAVFVEPDIGGHPIGVKATEKTPAYIFPLRTGKDTIYRLPDQLAMYSEPRLRRIFILMSAIPLGTQIRVASITRAGQGPEMFLGVLRELSLERNVVLFDCYSNWGPAGALVPKATGPTAPKIIALDQIRSVYRPTSDDASEQQWNILTEPFV